jgi:enoyl-CoA hydratase/carnithine racemase
MMSILCYPRVVVIEANGPVFSSGHDMKEMMVCVGEDAMLALQLILRVDLFAVDEKGRALGRNRRAVHAL